MRSQWGHYNIPIYICIYIYIYYYIYTCIHHAIHTASPIDTSNINGNFRILKWRYFTISLAFLAIYTIFLGGYSLKWPLIINRFLLKYPTFSHGEFASCRTPSPVTGSRRRRSRARTRWGSHSPAATDATVGSTQEKRRSRRHWFFYGISITWENDEIHIDELWILMMIIHITDWWRNGWLPKTSVFQRDHVSEQAIAISIINHTGWGPIVMFVGL